MLPSICLSFTLRTTINHLSTSLPWLDKTISPFRTFCSSFGPSSQSLQRKTAARATRALRDAAASSASAALDLIVSTPSLSMKSGYYHMLGKLEQPADTGQIARQGQTAHASGTATARQPATQGAMGPTLSTTRPAPSMYAAPNGASAA